MKMGSGYISEARCFVAFAAGSRSNGAGSRSNDAQFAASAGGRGSGTLFCTAGMDLRNA